MKSTDFNKLVEEQIQRIKTVLKTKTQEYNLEDDRLRFFKRAAAIQHCSPDSALIGMLTKHIVSIYDMVRTEQKYPIERWEEKITDSINYLLLLYALEVEKNTSEVPTNE